LSFAKVSLPLLFCDNMVLQQNSEVNFWGKANPSEKVTILVSWQKKKI
jgi:unsaturated rhamnogalacturonyl hydrolase